MSNNTVENKSTKVNTLKNSVNTTEKQEYKKKLLDIEVSQLKGIYPIMLNFNKIMSILKSKNVKVSPKSSYKLLGEYVNRYNSINESDEDKIESHKEFLQLNNNFDTLIETIRLFSKSGTITPKSFINVINNLVLYYNESNKSEILIHYAYLAEIIYQHFSKLMDNTEIKRNDFFENEIALDIQAIMECAEFYYTDIYMLNQDEKRDFMSLLGSYYLEEVALIAIESNKAEAEAEAASAQLIANTEAAKKAKVNSEKNNSKKVDKKLL